MAILALIWHASCFCCVVYYCSISSPVGFSRGFCSRRVFGYFSRLVLSLILSAFATLAASGQTNFTIGPEASLPLLSSQLFLNQHGTTPADGSVQALNPPIFNWIYNGDNPWNFAVDTSPRTFEFQLSTNANFSPLYWDIFTSNNCYNTLPPITNADGSTWQGTNYWQIIYGNSTATSILATGMVHTFTLSSSAANWDRSMLADSNYLYSVLSPHPHMAFWATNRAAALQFFTTYSAGNFNWINISNMAVQAVTNSWWTNSSVFSKQSAGNIIGNDFYYLFWVSFVYQLTTNSYLASYHPEIMYDQFIHWYTTNGMDRIAAYDSDDTAAKMMPMVMDYLWPLMNAKQQGNAIYALDEAVKFYVNEDWWFYGSPADTNRIYAYTNRLMSFQGAGKEGGSHQRYDADAGLAMCMGGWASSSNLQYYFPYFLNYMLAINDPCAGDEGRAYNDDRIWTSRAFGANAMAIYAFRQARLELNPFYVDDASQFSYMEPVNYQSWTEPWGDLGYTPVVPLGARLGDLAYDNQLYFWDSSYMTGDGAMLQQYNHQNPGGFVGGVGIRGSPQFDALTSFYFSTPPVQRSWPTNFYIDPVRGYCVCASYQPNDYNAFSNGVGFVTQARPDVQGNHGMYSDGSVQLWAYGASANSGGCQSYQKHPMFHSGAIMVDGIGIDVPPCNPAEQWYSRFTAFTNTVDYSFVSMDTTKAYNRSNWNTGSDWSQRPSDHIFAPFYDYSTNKRPYLSSMMRNVIFPHKKYLVLYDTMATTQPAHFQWIWHFMETNNASVNTNGCSFTYTCTNFFNGSNVTVCVVPFVNSNSMALSYLPGTNNYYTNPVTGESYAGNTTLNLSTPAPLPNGTIWVQNVAATNAWHFGWVIYPVKWNGIGPTITRINDNSVSVQDGDNNDTITIDPTTTPPTVTMELTGSDLGVSQLLAPSNLQVTLMP